MSWVWHPTDNQELPALPAPEQGCGGVKESLTQLTECQPIPDVSCTPGNTQSTDPRSVPRDLVPLCWDSSVLPSASPPWHGPGSSGSSPCGIPRAPHSLWCVLGGMSHPSSGRDEPPLTQHPEFPQHVPAARSKPGDGTWMGHHILPAPRNTSCPRGTDSASWDPVPSTVMG